MMKFYSKRNITMSLIFSSILFSSNIYCMFANGWEKTKKIVSSSVLNPNNYVRAATISSLLHQVNAITSLECFDMCAKEFPKNATFITCLDDCLKTAINITDDSFGISVAVAVPCAILLLSGGMILYNKKCDNSEKYAQIE
ncbi:MAG TPA: hypothetical protein VL201_04925 [Patescibacteria group bacterium]|nr:hypothetical protein [Patescibacteria group bacterium]